MTAQETFRIMMREQVAPALRELGFKGSGQVFTVPSDKYWAVLGFQKSKFSAAAVEFTVNLTVVPKDAWARVVEAKPHFPARPWAESLSIMEDVPNGWSERLGSLLPTYTGASRWWRVEPDRPTEPVANEVISMIREYGLPEMQRRMP